MLPAIADINALLSSEALRLSIDWQLLETVDSTNSSLLRQWDCLADRVVVQIASQQTAGRGRQGDAWLGEPDSHLFFSMHWPWRGAESKSAMSLVCAKAVALALGSLLGSPKRVKVKWPNDLWVGDAKLAGFLLESQSSEKNPGGLVVGLGLNIKPLPSALKKSIARPAVALSELGELPPRAVIVASIVNAIVEAALLAECSGFSAALVDWEAVDACLGRSISVTTAQRVIRGVGSGITPSGELLVQTESGLECVHSGRLQFTGACSV